VVFLFFTNEQQFAQDEVWHRAFFGLATGAVCAVAGVYFAESRPRSPLANILVGWVLPLAVAASFEVTATEYFVPYVLPVVAVMWLSVSPVVSLGRGAGREELQNRFWWANHRAVESAMIGAAALLIICLGLIAITGALRLLFGVGLEDIVYRWMLPIAAFFLTPLYWLSTLPRLTDYAPGALDDPEFTSRAVGFLGQFLLVPLLLIYGLILVAYTVQIVVTRSIPQGIIGWMVPGFTIIGAATWLALYPAFLRDRPLVRFFRRWWFWLTLIPLALFFVAVWVRVDAYGFTPERLLLLTGGVWAALLSIAFLVRRGDIRLVPALAGGLLLAISIGPWNFVNLPVADQLGRLEALLAAGPAQWTAADAADARGAIQFLSYGHDDRRPERLAALLARHGVTFRPDVDSPEGIMVALGYQGAPNPEQQLFDTVRRDPLTAAVDVSATPFYIGSVALHGAGTVQSLGLWLKLDGRTLSYAASGHAPDALTLDLGDWIDRQGKDLVDPAVAFTVSGVDYRLVLDEMELTHRGHAPAEITRIAGVLFADRPPATP
jgi:hypothetical protein